jgi:hypothetical protein
MPKQKFSADMHSSSAPIASIGYKSHITTKLPCTLTLGHALKYLEHFFLYTGMAYIHVTTCKATADLMSICKQPEIHSNSHTQTVDKRYAEIRNELLV